MTFLPQPDDLTSLILRTDFSDDAGWQALKSAIDSQDTSRHATCVSDPEYAEVSIQALIDMDAAASDDDKLTYLFLADATTMNDEERPLLAIDLHTEPGRVFRLPPRWYVDVSANLCIANLGFDDFADAVDDSGTFRGFGGESSDARP